MSADILLAAIREKNATLIVKTLFSEEKIGKDIYINATYRTENEILDYKEKLPNIDAEKIEWAELAKDVLAFHNTHKGGIIVFGIRDKDYDIVGISSERRKVDSKIINDKIRKYVGDQLWVELFNPITIGKKDIAILIVPPLYGNIKRFIANGPEKKGRCLFVTDGTALRQNDSSVLFDVTEADKLNIQNSDPSFDLYSINSGNFRLLAPDYSDFIRRERYCAEIKKGLEKNRVACVTLTGIGGIGKTSLAIWAVNEEYIQKRYSYIVSLTAKDRELTASGIQAIYQKFTTLDDLLDGIAEVIGLPDLKNLKVEEKEKEIRTLIEDSNMLLFLDNLETTSDDGIKEFINDLPDGVKAIITSRRNIVNVSSYPIEIGGLEEEETIQLINVIAKQYPYCNALTRVEKLKIGVSCNSIPLAIKWIISRCSSVAELNSMAATLQLNKHNNAELLEFVFRRTFDNMNKTEQRIMQILAIAPDIPEEAIIQGRNRPEDDILGSLQKLVQDTIVIKKYDADINWYRYSLLPLTREFIIRNVLPPAVDRAIRNKLTIWYQAEDVYNPDERIVVQQMRQNGQNVGGALVTLAEAAVRRGDFDAAKKLYEMAMTRDPQNWIVHKSCAEYYRKIEDSRTLAIQHYKNAIDNLPKKIDPLDEGVLRREFALIYMGSGERDAIDLSIENLAIAHQLMPYDPITANFLGQCYMKKSFYEKAIGVLEPFQDAKDMKTKEKIRPILLECYKAVPIKYKLEIAALEDKIQKEK